MDGWGAGPGIQLPGPQERPKNKMQEQAGGNLPGTKSWVGESALALRHLFGRSGLGAPPTPRTSVRRALTARACRQLGFECSPALAGGPTGRTTHGGMGKRGGINASKKKKTRTN